MLQNDVFDIGMKRLSVLFDKKLNDPLKDIYYDNVKYSGEKDFEMAVRKIERNEKRFPSPAVFVETLSAIISDRVEQEADEHKRKEQREIENLKRARANDPKETERNKARLREIINAIGNGGELKRLAEKYRKENIESSEMEFPPVSSCHCDNGIVEIRDKYGYLSIAGCAKCGRGNQNLAQVDPLTLDLKRDLNKSAWENGRK